MNTNVYGADAIVKKSRTAQARSRRISLAAGALYLITFLAIPAAALYTAVRQPNYVTGPGPDNAIILGGILEIIVALACIGTAVALYPAVKRQSEAFALGFVGAHSGSRHHLRRRRQPDDAGDLAPVRGRRGSVGHRAGAGGPV